MSVDQSPCPSCAVAVTAALVVAAALTSPRRAGHGRVGPSHGDRPCLAASTLQAAPKLSGRRAGSTRPGSPCSARTPGTAGQRRTHGRQRLVCRPRMAQRQLHGRRRAQEHRHRRRYRNQISDWAASKRPLSGQPADATVTKRPPDGAAGATANGAAHQVWRVVTADGDGITATYVDAGSGETLRTDELAQEFDDKGPGTSVTGRGRVFDPNPVVALQREGLTDRHDTSYPLIRDAYNDVKLRRLDGSHSLKGQWVRITNGNRRRRAPTPTASAGPTGCSSRSAPTTPWTPCRPTSRTWLHRRQRRGAEDPHRRHLGRQLLLRPGQRPDRHRDRRSRRRGGPRGGLARVRPRGPGRPGPELRHDAPGQPASAKASATTWRSR